MKEPDEFPTDEAYEEYLDDQRDRYEYEYDSWRDDEHARLSDETDEFIKKQLSRPNNYFDSEEKLLSAIMSHIRYRLNVLRAESNSKKRESQG